MSLSFPSIWVPGSSFILASCLIGKEAISSILLDQWGPQASNFFQMLRGDHRHQIWSNAKGGTTGIKFW